MSYFSKSTELDPGLVRPPGSQLVARILFLALCSVLLAVSSPASAQQLRKASRLGVLLYSDPKTDPNLTVSRQGPPRLGYIEGQNLLIDYGSAEGKPQRLPALS